MNWWDCVGIWETIKGKGMQISRIKAVLRQISPYQLMSSRICLALKCKGNFFPHSGITCAITFLSLWGEVLLGVAIM